MRKFVIVAERASPTNRALVAAFRGAGVPATRNAARQLQAARLLGRLDGAVLLGRADVSRSLNGVGETFWELRRLEREGFPVLNGSETLLRCHDKLQTARRLGRVGLPHPRTALLRHATDVPPFAGPYVVKPRFGSWGRDVVRCADALELRACLSRLSRKRWFRARGALVQEYVACDSVDLRIIVAAGQVVGAIERVAAEGEWRTNIAVGGVRRPVDPPAVACELARRAAAAVEGDLVGVDLLPGSDGSYTIIELNGAVDFTDAYGEDIFERIVSLFPHDVTVPAEPQLGLGLSLPTVPTPNGPDAAALPASPG
jgi:RimK family alpha-L-glutamate ligase